MSTFATTIHQSGLSLSFSYTQEHYSCVDMVCLKDPLVQTICQLYDDISQLDNLRPSEPVNKLFTQLVLTCIPPHPIDIANLPPNVKEIRNKLIRICGKAEGLLEAHYSDMLAEYEEPIKHIQLFPYYNNYLKLARIEFNLLIRHAPAPRRMAFVGSGPLPLTPIVLALNHMKTTVFHNFDIDPSANSMAAKLIADDADLSGRMEFFTDDIVNVPAGVLREYDVVFLAALVGMDMEEKMSVIEHLATSMAPGAVLMLRSAHGARAFLYPVVEPRHLQEFEVLSVFHPTDEVINSVVIARRVQKTAQLPVRLCNKCGEMKSCGAIGLVEEIAVDEHIC